MTQIQHSDIVIFLDMDGVISDFDTHAQDKYNDAGKFKYEEMDFEWWSSMPVFDKARDFYETLKQKAEVNFLTGPMLSAGSFGGKAKWVESFINKWALGSLIVCPKTKKHFLAGPDRILIDDNAQNIKDWEAAGGVGIHHQGDYQQTLQKLDAVITGMTAKPFNPKLKPAE